MFISIGFSFPIHIIGEAPPCLPQEVKNCVWPAMGKYWIVKFHFCEYNSTVPQFQYNMKLENYNKNDSFENTHLPPKESESMNIANS